MTRILLKNYQGQIQQPIYKVYYDIRKLFARQPLAETRKYKIGFFSFSADGGEAQRIKLASFLGKGNTPKKHYLFLMSLLRVYIFMI